jgi:Carbohydrate binding domain
MNQRMNLIASGVALCGFAVASSGGIVFSDDFESGLGQWTGQGGGSHQGVIVADPLGGSNNVLTFSGLNSGGDMFGLDLVSLDSNTIYSISFDFLGLAQIGSVIGDTGGYVGFAAGTPGVHNWEWATGSAGADDVLVDDGQWNSYTFEFTVASLGIGNSVRLMVEDFVGSGGVSGDVYFDNFVVATVPIPSSAALALIGLGLGGVVSIRRQHRSRR